MFTLAAAARHAGVTKTSVHRWVKSGKVSASKAADGTLRIDPAELRRYLDSVAAVTVRDGTRDGTPEQSVMAPDIASLRERYAAIEAENAALKQMLATERE